MSSLGKCGRVKYGNGKNEEIVHLTVTVTAVNKTQNLTTIYRFCSPFALYADVLDSGLLALCGPNRVMDESTCECVCQNGLTEDSCGPGWKLDHETCKQEFKYILLILLI